MKGEKVLFSSKSDEWATPQSVFDELDREFHFTIDAAASAENAKCDRYYSAEDSGLEKNWEGESVFCNPPYSKIKEWVEKAHDEGQKDNTVVVLLVPARTDTRWFHDYIHYRAEVRFIKGRLCFSGSKTTAPFPSMIVIFRGANRIG